MDDIEDDGDKTIVPVIGASHITGRDTYRTAATSLARAAVRKLAILSYDFNPEIYGDQDFVDAMRKLALAHRMAEIRILIHSPTLAMRRGHRAVELGRQITTYIHFRELAERHRDVVEDLVIADQLGYLRRDSPDTLDAMYAGHDPGEARTQLARFDRMWDHGIPSAEMRTLGI